MPKSEKGENKPEFKTKYSEGEKVLCYHGKLLYEAKIISIDAEDKDREYSVHYNGWNKAWDEWVPDTRIVKHNEAGREKQKSLQIESQSEKSRQKSKKKKKEPDNVKKKKKSQEQPVINSPLVGSPVKGASNSRLVVSASLHKRLLDNADAICKHNKLCPLPAAVTVDLILDQFVEEMHRAEPDQSKTGICDEVCDGIKRYFNTVLGTQLLYREEKEQFAECCAATGFIPSRHYGGDHLLRLFVKYGPILSLLSSEEDCQLTLLSYLQSILRYLEDKSDNIFNKEYSSSETL